MYKHQELVSAEVFVCQKEQNWVKKTLLCLSDTSKTCGYWWINANTPRIPGPEALWNRAAVLVKSLTFVCTEPYFGHAVGGYFSLGFTVAVPGMITPAAVWNIFMQMAAMGGTGLESSIRHLGCSPAAHRGFPQLAVLNSQPPSK